MLYVSRESLWGEITPPGRSRQSAGPAGVNYQAVTSSFLRNIVSALLRPARRCFRRMTSPRPWWADRRGRRGFAAGHAGLAMRPMSLPCAPSRLLSPGPTHGLRQVGAGCAGGYGRRGVQETRVREASGTPVGTSDPRPAGAWAGTRTGNPASTAGIARGARYAGARPVPRFPPAEFSDSVGQPCPVDACCRRFPLGGPSTGRVPVGHVPCRRWPSVSRDPCQVGRAGKESQDLYG
ncbi:hypothetical protein FsymDg_1132 [Candidatus Protofrankia datiscae]|uniref:Uncharacterized protein n=1 Tax=Candidatus Protofrankia datiscae TaxID=2716812 RepID=F8AZF7_9ACTN|nr:hypothetical protein FsymDg_1132 [Candidatus Protofrankia datiscae]